MKKQIIKLAAITLRRVGLLTWLFFCISFCFSFYATSSYIEVSQLKGKPCEIIAITDTPVDLSLIKNIPSVVKVTPSIRQVSQIRYVDKEVQVEVKSVMSSFLDYEKIDGTVFPDSSSMPYLVVNSVAEKLLVDEHNQTSNALIVGEEVQILFEDYLPAVICGVYEDGDDSPVVYLSYGLSLERGNRSEDTQICILVKNAGSLKAVARELKRNNLTILTPIESTREEWANQVASFWRSISCGMAFFFCAVTLSNKSLQVELIQHWDEIKNLRLSGLSIKNLKEVMLLRQVGVMLICIMVSSALTWYFESFSIAGLGCNVLLSATEVFDAVIVVAFHYQRIEGGKYNI